MAHDHDHGHEHHHHHHGASPDAPIVCEMGVFSPQQRRRYDTLAKKLRAAALEIREVETGYAMRLSDAKISVPEAGEWMLLESKCCPFLEIALEPEGGALWMRLSGRAGVKEFLKSEFGL
jgi:hypothetical protein